MADWVSQASQQTVAEVKRQNEVDFEDDVFTSKKLRNVSESVTHKDRLSSQRTKKRKEPTFSKSSGFSQSQTASQRSRKRTKTKDTRDVTHIDLTLDDDDEVVPVPPPTTQPSPSKRSTAKNRTSSTRTTLSATDFVVESKSTGKIVDSSQLTPGSQQKEESHTQESKERDVVWNSEKAHLLQEMLYLQKTSGSTNRISASDFLSALSTDTLPSSRKRSEDGRKESSQRRSNSASKPRDEVDEADSLLQVWFRRSGSYSSPASSISNDSVSGESGDMCLQPAPRPRTRISRRDLLQRIKLVYERLGAEASKLLSSAGSVPGLPSTTQASPSNSSDLLNFDEQLLDDEALFIDDDFMSELERLENQMREKSSENQPSKGLDNSNKATNQIMTAATPSASVQTTSAFSRNQPSPVPVQSSASMPKSVSAAAPLHSAQPANRVTTAASNSTNLAAPRTSKVGASNGTTNPRSSYNANSCAPQAVSTPAAADKPKRGYTKATAPVDLDEVKQLEELLQPSDLDLDFMNVTESSVASVSGTPLAGSSISSSIPSSQLHSLPSVTSITSLTVEPISQPSVYKDPFRTHEKYRRFRVDEVTESHGSVHGTVVEKRLRVFDEYREVNGVVVLRGLWIDTPVESGDFINVVGKCEPNDPSLYIVDNERNMVVLHPDRLVSGTILSLSFECMRRAFLSELCKTKAIKGEDDAAAVYGNFIHQVFQRAILSENFNLTALQASAEEIILSNLDSIYAVQQTEETARKNLSVLLPTISNWGKAYFKKDISSSFSNAPSLNFHKTNYQVAVAKAMKVEERIWSLMYGLKGNIDVTVVASLKKCASDDGIQLVEMPLELKSGKRTVNHDAQVISYALLMADRYDREIKGGLLFSMKDKQMSGVTIERLKAASILIQRNKLARYLTKNIMPPVVQKQSLCSKCFQRQFCSIYHKALENGTRETMGLSADLFDSVVGHLSPADSEFIAHWERLLNLELQETFYHRTDIWCTSADERVKQGKCIINLRVADVQTVDNRYVYIFVDNYNQPLSIFELQMHKGDYVIISTDRHIGVAVGIITEMTTTYIAVSLKDKLEAPPLEDESSPTSQRFNGLRQGSMGVLVPPSVRISEQNIEDLGQLLSQFSSPQRRLVRTDVRSVLWRLDKDELSSGFSSIRANLLEMFLPHARSTKLRSLIVDMTAPDFTPVSQQLPPGASSLNPDQLLATQKVLSAKDYTLILGMPGTGKTHTIAFIVSALVAQGKSVLITAYTHSAVDNLLLKVRQLGVPFVRLGSRDQVLPELHDHLLNVDSSVKSVKDLEERYGDRGMLVVATTCLGIHHPLLQRRTFDYCIVDEASQITLPVCIGPLLYAKCFILVGDLYQLPPLVRNAEAKVSGLADSLFKRLSEAHPSAVVALQYQYRMNADIMTLANELIYNNRLQCGTPSIANSCLNVPNINALPKPSRSPHIDWLRDIINPERRVVFANTDSVPAPERSDDLHVTDLARNETEAKLVVQLTEALLMTGISPSAIGIISPWRAQLKAIHHFLRTRNLDTPQLEVNTVDKYQGRDKECIIISLVRSNPQKDVGSLLKDWRRVNVAITRAKQKLVVFGSWTTLHGTALLKTFLTIIDNKGWRYDLPHHADTIYSFPDTRAPTRDSSPPPRRYVGHVRTIVPTR